MCLQRSCSNAALPDIWRHEGLRPSIELVTPHADDRLLGWRRLRRLEGTPAAMASACRPWTCPSQSTISAPRSATAPRQRSRVSRNTCTGSRLASPLWKPTPECQHMWGCTRYCCSDWPMGLHMHSPVQPNDGMTSNHVSLAENETRSRETSRPAANRKLCLLDCAAHIDSEMIRIPVHMHEPAAMHALVEDTAS